MLDVAVEELGADRATYSTVERINSGTAKIDRLREICPKVFAPGANVVAMTDTNNGAARTGMPATSIRAVKNASPPRCSISIVKHYTYGWAA